MTKKYPASFLAGYSDSKSCVLNFIKLGGYRQSTPINCEGIFFQCGCSWP